MKLGRVIVLVMPLVSLLGCGGQTLGVRESDGGSGDGGGPSGQCPPPATLQSGLACSDPGQTCDSSMQIPACHGGPASPVSCFCGSGGTWECGGGVLCSQPVPCPVPSQVTPNGVCQTDPSFSCQSSEEVRDCDGGVLATGACSCIGGTWSSCSIDAGVPVCCPDPAQVASGLGCAIAGELCPGNPTWCFGTALYDAFSCNGGVWVDVAATVCEGADAGVGEAGLGD